MATQTNETSINPTNHVPFSDAFPHPSLSHHVTRSSSYQFPAERYLLDHRSLGLGTADSTISITEGDVTDAMLGDELRTASCDELSRIKSSAPSLYKDLTKSCDELCMTGDRTNVLYRDMTSDELSSVRQNNARMKNVVKIQNSDEEHQEFSHTTTSANQMTASDFITQSSPLKKVFNQNSLRHKEMASSCDQLSPPIHTTPLGATPKYQCTRGIYSPVPPARRKKLAATQAASLCVRAESYAGGAGHG